MSIRIVTARRFSVLLGLLSLSGCKQAGQAIQALAGNGEVVQLAEKEIRAAPRCAKECRDFQVVCSRAVEVTRADQLNGIAERIVIGLKYVYFEDTTYHEGQSLLTYTKKNGTWVNEPVSGMPVMEGCGYI